VLSLPCFASNATPAVSRAFSIMACTLKLWPSFRPFTAQPADSRSIPMQNSVPPAAVRSKTIRWLRPRSLLRLHALQSQKAFRSHPRPVAARTKAALFQERSLPSDIESSRCWAEEEWARSIAPTICDSSNRLR